MNKKLKNIEQLYSGSFNDFRLEPSSGLWKSISSKLAWRNFFTFTPTTLNAWYVAGLLTIATAGVLLITKPTTKSNPETKEITINNTIENSVITPLQENAAEPKEMTKQEGRQKAEGRGQKQDSSIKNTTTQHPATSTQNPETSNQKTDSSINDLKLVTRNPKLETLDSKLATPHPKPTQQPALSSEVSSTAEASAKAVTKEDTQHQAPSTNLPDPWLKTLDSLFTNNTPTPPEYKIEFPNAFTPNTNGPTNGYYTPGLPNNDVFHPEHKGVTEYHLEIYNRRGELIFECNDINIGWDGYINSRLVAQGVYVWKARGKYSNGESFVKFGNVMLIKK